MAASCTVRYLIEVVSFKHSSYGFHCTVHLPSFNFSGWQMASSLMDRKFSPPRSIKEEGGDRWRAGNDSDGNERWRSSNDVESGGDRWSRRDGGGDRSGTQRRGSSRDRSPRRPRDRGLILRLMRKASPHCCLFRGWGDLSCVENHEWSKMVSAGLFLVDIGLAICYYSASAVQPRWAIFSRVQL